MPSISNVSIHVTTSGDVVLDQLISAKESLKSPAALNVQVIPPNISTQIKDPSGNLVFVGYQVTGILIVPPQDNVTPYNISFLTPQQDPIEALYHPTNPMFLSVIHYNPVPYLYHEAPTPLVFHFFWI